ncbi:MAG: hypothetical protein GY906_24325 [bacterium]|nr:hypothetical protein [bacterium]
MTDKIISLASRRVDFDSMEFHCDCTNRTFIILGSGMAKCAMCGEYAVGEDGPVKGLWHTPPDMQVEEGSDDDTYQTVTSFSGDEATKARIVRAANEVEGMIFAVFGWDTGRTRAIYMGDFSEPDQISWLWRRLRQCWKDMIQGKP